MCEVGESGPVSGNVSRGDGQSGGVVSGGIALFLSSVLFILGCIV